MVPNTARWVSAVVGIWLFLSAFFWPHTTSQYTNTWIMGIIAVAVALISVGSPGFRWLNTAVGVWLIISSFALPSMNAATRWNNFIVGVVIGLLSLVGSSPGATIRQPRTA